MGAGDLSIHHPQMQKKPDHRILSVVVQSSGIPDLSGSGDHSYRHYRIGKDVVLRLESISPKETKVCACFNHLSDSATRSTAAFQHVEW